MKINNLINYLLIGLLITAFTSCQKENIDTTTTIEEEVTQIVTCDDWTMEIIDEVGPAGNGNLSPISDGGTPPYSYAWSTGDSTQNIMVNDEGAFSLTITDSEGCIVMDTIVVEFNDPCNSLFAQIIQIANTAETLNSLVQGGTLPYAYEWSTGETTENITITNIGTYSLLVIDAEGCTFQTQINVSNIDSSLCDDFSIVLSEQPPGSGDLYSSIIGGTPSYLYSWSTGENTSNISIDSSGVYSITVTDSNGCIAEQFIQL